MPVSYSENTGELEDAIGYRFRDSRLLVEALTHSSYHNENPGDSLGHNERLEFLGDSVLGLAVAEILYRDALSLTEAEMSKMRSYLVRESVLFDVAYFLSLGKYLRLGRGEESTGGRQKKSVLSDALEALVGAVFLDSGYGTVKDMVGRLLGDRIAMVIAKKEGLDFKSELQERCQGLLGKPPDYRIVKQEGEEHRKIFTAEVVVDGLVSGAGKGRSKKEAEMAAAREALKKMTP
ncbi:MAG TPA: ribonuclease III [Dissulfurispiraceae bacterium]|nr:ribonuclease III [Dissulfurispiraceae bacterium]